MTLTDHGLSPVTCYTNVKEMAKNRPQHPYKNTEKHTKENKPLIYPLCATVIVVDPDIGSDDDVLWEDLPSMDSQEMHECE